MLNVFEEKSHRYAELYLYWHCLSTQPQAEHSFFIPTEVYAISYLISPYSKTHHSIPIHSIRGHDVSIYRLPLQQVAAIVCLLSIPSSPTHPSHWGQ